MRRLCDDHGYTGLRPSLGPFLSLVWSEGRPLTAIAAQLRVSKQACSQLANVAERAGYLQRKPDPQDRRAKVVLLSARGRALVQHAVEIILESDSEYADLLGPTAYRHFTASLAELFAGLGIPTHTDPALVASAGQSVGLLPLIAVRMQEALMQATTARGHAGLKMSHAQVLPLIGPEGARMHEIARVQRVSRQAISATAQDLEALGYVRRESDPLDRRSVLVKLTARGTRLIRDSVAELDGLDESFCKILGKRRHAQLLKAARELYQALHLEEEIFEARTELPESNGAAPRTHPVRETQGIRGLASTLRRQLSSEDTARLAALLERPGEKATP